MGVCNCSMFCCTLLCVRSSIAITLMGKRELVALLKLSSWCLVMVERLFLSVPQGCLRFVIFPDHTHLLVLVSVTADSDRFKDAILLCVFAYSCVCLFLWGFQQLRASLTLQETRSIHDSINIPKIKFIS